MRIKENTWITILIIFYLVGTIGLMLPAYRASFLHLSFFILTLSFCIVLITRKREKFKFFLFLLMYFIVGYSVEYIGTQTGLLFGSYSYGNNLGYKLHGVPLVIGLNWGMLVVIAASTVNKLKVTNFFKATIAAVLITGFDFLMEPVAIKSGFWTWENGTIPVYNYICWYSISLVLLLVYFKFNLGETNKVFNALFIILVIFFSILLIF